MAKRKREADSDDESQSGDERTASGDRYKQYEKITQHEHILARPDTYIGSVEYEDKHTWIYDKETKSMKKTSLKIVPGLHKIFDEILVNAADNKVRCPAMTFIKVHIDPEKNEISVENDGDGIPIEMHQEHNIWVPSLIFGELLTGSSFKDDDEKVTGGRNGYGAKLANIYSTKFTLETVDSKVGKKFVQIWEDNMKTKNKPKITKSTRKKEYTKITFSPDLSRFNMEKLDDDIVNFMTRRVFDIAATTEGIKVYLNGEKVPVKSFKDYVKLYTQGKKTVFEKVNDRWELAVCESDGDGLEQVSFVNSIFTGEGGKHVDYILGKLSKGITDYATKKNKGIVIKPGHIKQHLCIFLKCLIVNASFNSQTKDKLTTQQRKFGSKCDIDDALMKKICTKTDVVKKITEYSKYKQNAKLKNKLSAGKKKRVTGIQKLEDANDAGGRNAHLCTLILTEGDSAKALAVAGLSVVGRDRYGVFPLRGKLLNVRKSKMTTVNRNEEISNIVKIMGLKFNKVYTKQDVKSLRYGSIMVMADQDHDGSHIKGLLINFLHYYWPSLLKVPGFLKEFITPIVKVRNNRNKKQEVSFFTIPEYEHWKERNNEGRGWTIKYYKGLGTSTAKEAKAYFSNLNKHVISFRYDEDYADEKIKMAFSSTDADARKQWINTYEEGTFVNHTECVRTKLAYRDFVDKELVLFSIADTQRSIPSLVDGFKPSQRKILYSCFKRNLKKEVKVAQLSGYVSEHSAYHHGEQSLAGAIIGMAQNFVGSNNINLLNPSGQFGTRLQGGKDHASPRYVFTSLAEITRVIFQKADDNILEYLDDDGQLIEPKFYLPTIPMILVNGCEGIGTGYSSKIPNFNPVDIVENLRLMLEGEAPKDMNPWYKRFTGDIGFKKLHTYESKGIINELEDNTFEIVELPIKSWTESYKEMLEKYEESDQIQEFRQNHTDTTVSFTVYMSQAQRDKAENKKGLESFFRLTSLLHTSNMTLFDAEGKLKKYDHVLDILKDFYTMRLEAYSDRKEFLMRYLRRELLILDNRVRFILAVVNGELVVRKKKKKDLLKELKDMKFDPYPEPIKRKVQNTIINPEAAAVGTGAETEGDGEEDMSIDEKSFDYLLSMPLWSLTMERVKKLEDEKAAKKKEVANLKKTTPKQLWLKDLDDFEEKYQLVLEKEERELEKQRAKEMKRKSKPGKRVTSRKKSAPKKKATTKKTKKSKKDEEADEKPKKAASKKASTKKTKKTKKDEDVDEKPKKTTPKKASTKKTSKSQKLVSLLDSDDDSDDEIVPLKGKSSKKTFDFLDESEEETVAVASKKTSKKAPPRKKRKVEKSSNKKISEYFSPKAAKGDDSSDVEMISPEKSTTKKKSRKKTTEKKKRRISGIVSDEDEAAFENYEEDGDFSFNQAPDDEDDNMEDFVVDPDEEDAMSDEEDSDEE